MLIREAFLDECESELKTENPHNWDNIKSSILDGSYLLFNVSDSFLVIDINNQDGIKTLRVVTGVAKSSILPVIIAMKQMAKNLQCDFLEAFACREALAELYATQGFELTEYIDNGSSHLWGVK